MLRTLGLGAGVQSTTLALMATTGDIEPLDAAIFSDTGWEPRAVYEHLVKLEAHLAAHGVPVYRVSAGNIREDHADPQHEHLFIRRPRLRPDLLGKQRTSMPVYVITEDGAPMRYLGDGVSDDEYFAAVEDGRVHGGKKGRTRRTCTKTYKIEPVERKQRELLGIPYRGRWPLAHSIDHLLGISWDETQRMRDSDRPAVHFEYPLVDMRVTRDDCHVWLAEHGWPDVPRSACVGCPFHRNDEWRNLRDNYPEEWADAVEFDKVFRQRQRDGLLTLEGVPYLHDQRVPLDQADIDRDTVKAISDLATGSNTFSEQLSFGDECEGFCGT